MSPDMHTQHVKYSKG